MKSFFGIGLNDKDICALHFKSHKKRREDINKNYLISFGKYTGTKLIDMKSPEQLKYINWFVSELKKKNDTKGARYKAFNWWLINYQLH